MQTKLIVDEEGKIRNEYVEDDGSISVGDYDMVPLIDRFVEEHPDFLTEVLKESLPLPVTMEFLVIAQTAVMKTCPGYLDADKVKWLDEHPDLI